MDSKKMKNYLKDVMTLETEKYRLEEIKSEITKAIEKTEAQLSENVNFDEETNRRISILNRIKDSEIREYLDRMKKVKSGSIITYFIVAAVFAPIVLYFMGSTFLAIVSVFALLFAGFHFASKKSNIELIKESKEVKEHIAKIEKEYIVKIKETKDKYGKESSEKEKDYVSKRKELMIFCKNNKDNIKSLDKEYKEVTDKLKELYDLDYIFEKYRNISAITMFYEYFSSSRVFELEGKDGAYNLYEAELRQNLIISNLGKINEHLEDIKDNQYCMYNEMKNVNSSLKIINRNLVDGLNDIAKIETANLAVNAEISKNVNTIKRIQVHNFIFDK